MEMIDINILFSVLLLFGSGVAIGVTEAKTGGIRNFLNHSRIVWYLTFPFLVLIVWILSFPFDWYWSSKASSVQSYKSLKLAKKAHSLRYILKTQWDLRSRKQNKNKP